MSVLNNEFLNALQNMRRTIQHIRNLGAIEAESAKKYFGSNHPNTLGALAFVGLGDRMIKEIKAREAISVANLKQETIGDYQAHLQGRVVDDSKLPIEGAIVKLEDNRCNVLDCMVTDATGVYSFVTEADADGTDLKISVYDKNNTKLSSTPFKVAAKDYIITDIRADKTGSMDTKNCEKCY
jgi:hypothetical protein